MRLKPAHRATHAAVKALWDEMNRQKASPLAVTRKAGVCDKTVRNWRNGTRSPKLAEIEACLNVMGLRLVVAGIS